MLGVIIRLRTCHFVPILHIYYFQFHLSSGSITISWRSSVPDSIQDHTYELFWHTATFHPIHMISHSNILLLISRTISSSKTSISPFLYIPIAKSLPTIQSFTFKKREICICKFQLT